VLEDDVGILVAQAAGRVDRPDVAFSRARSVCAEAVSVRDNAVARTHAAATAKRIIFSS